jgi:hypothetical protein
MVGLTFPKLFPIVFIAVRCSVPQNVQVATHASCCARRLCGLYCLPLSPRLPSTPPPPPLPQRVQHNVILNLTRLRLKRAPSLPRGLIPSRDKTLRALPDLVYEMFLDARAAAAQLLADAEVTEDCL